MTDEAIDDAKSEEINSRKAVRIWGSRVKEWTRVLARGRDSNPQTVAIAEIRAVRDVAAIPAVEAVTLAMDSQSRARSPRSPAHGPGLCERAR